MREILVVNAGSSSLKLTLVGYDGSVTRTTVDDWDGRSTGPVVEFTERRGGGVDAVGHRIVHGGPNYIEPVVLDDTTLADLHALTELAPLHQPRALAAVDALGRLHPDIPSVACFDTAFHATLPPAARTYALPEAWRARWPLLRRFGFHGLSHASVARRLSPGNGERPGHRRIVSCHLGAGASLCAIVDGGSVDTTMGFTPLEGLVMARRSGSVDPGLLLWLLDGRLTSADLAQGLEHDAGLRGLAGGTGDLRDILARSKGGDTSASEAFDVYLHALVRGIGAMVASAGGLDALVFTGGVGEHLGEVRRAAVERLSWTGATIDDELDRAAGDRRVSPDGSTPAVWVLPAEEDLEIAAGVRVAIDPSPRSG